MRAFRLLVCTLFCLSLLGCPSPVSENSQLSILDKVEGQWVIDAEASLNESALIQGNSTADSIAKKMAQSVLKEVRLSIDPNNKTISGSLLGLSFTDEQFGIVDESNDSITILVLRTKLICTPKDDTLVVTTPGDTTTLIFLKEKQL